ncbi:MAG: hypothetical protein PHO37_14575 [Kiritimatiellae bacterium]|nr:hypothetical protein [Kiritimatiellia bacterium]
MKKNKPMRTATLSVCLFALALFANASRAATIGIDIEPGGQTEPGFASLTPVSPSVTIDGITFTLSAPGPLTGRDRGA